MIYVIVVFLQSTTDRVVPKKVTLVSSMNQYQLRERRDIQIIGRNKMIQFQNEITIGYTHILLRARDAII
jgi:hypothetical protein